MNIAFDQAMHKMEQQIKKYKEKLQDHRRDTPWADKPAGIRCVAALLACQAGRVLNFGAIRGSVRAGGSWGVTNETD